MKFPDSTYFNRKLPKQRFYENLTISAATKKSFVDQIKSIYWENKISADTINIAAENKVTEIEIFRINLNGTHFLMTRLDRLNDMITMENQCMISQMF